MTEQHPIDDADPVDFGDGDDFEGDLEEDFGDGDDLKEDFGDGDGDGEDLKEDFGDGDDLEEDFGDDENSEEDDDKGSDDDGDGSEDEDDDVPLPADEDDDEDVHPSDVEADLEEILRDRIAASDDDEEDEEEDVAGQTKTASVVAPPRSDEWTCNQCFLIVSMTQFGSRANPMCPSGEKPCESIERILSG